MTLKLYFDLMSQPSRALYILLKYAKIDFEPKLVDLRKGEHFTDEYAAVNRLKKVPVIVHNDFTLTESVAIVKYLARENLIPETISPKESKAQARLDEFMAWQHIGLRLHTSMFFRVKNLEPLMTGQPTDPKRLQRYERNMISALEEFDTKWLGHSDFVAGDRITVADLLAACELEQPRMSGFDPALKYKNIAAWWVKVRQHFSPYYEEAHIILNKIVQKNNAAKL
ncbi:unnamed protein product [Leptidea sinapis]|uniref:Uncharacterized protein n=2 Tax=Leptidea TaxID=189907 RepID=A0A5E4Q178_9NEOP|nr:unnamed protein product [Leptidea sinapis]